MARHIPNMLSMLRMILSVLLIPCMPDRIGFIVLYIVIGMTDVLDGLIARKFGYESDLGAKLDSIADYVFYSIFAFIFLNVYSFILKPVHQVALAGIISIRLINLLFTKWKYKKVIFVHTLANKGSGVMLYLMPLVLLFVHDGIVLWTVLSIVCAAVVEELLITVRYTEPDLNRRSIFFK